MKHLNLAIDLAASALTAFVIFEKHAAFFTGFAGFLACIYWVGRFAGIAYKKLKR